MSIDKASTKFSETKHQDGVAKQLDSQGGWRIKQRRVVSESNPEPPISSDSDRKSAQQPTASSPQGRRLPSWSVSLLSACKSQFFPIPRQHLPVLLLLAGIATGVIFALFLVNVHYSFDVEDQATGPEQTSVTEPGSGSSAEVGTANLNLWLQAVALPALEDEGQLPIYFRLSAPADWPVEITYQTSTHTAEADTDFVSLSGVITIPPGDRTVELVVPLIDDDLVERVETFRVTLSVDPKKATLTDSELMATVLDDDENAKANGY